MSMDNPQAVIKYTKKEMKKAVDHFENQLTKVRAGRANPQMLEDVTVDYYGQPTQVNHVASVKNLDAKTLEINPWEKDMLKEIEKGINEANLGITPDNDGDVIRLKLPPLTEERRKQLTKKLSEMAENNKITIRNVRKEANNKIKELTKEGLSEDAANAAEKEIQQLTDDNIEEIEKHKEAKEKELMKV